MSTHTDYVATNKTNIERVIRQARAARAETIRAAAHGFGLAIKRLFSALRPQAAH